MKKLIGFSLLFLLLPLSFSYSQANYSYNSVPKTFSFTRDLSQGNQGQDVSYLQCILGISPTGYFGPVTAGLLTQFQNDHADAILTPAGLTSGTGYMGASTRTYLNTQIAQEGADYAACGDGITGSNTQISYNNPNATTQTSQNTTQPTSCPVGYYCTPNAALQQQQLQQQQQQNSLLPLLPYFLSQNSGGRTINPNQNVGGGSSSGGNSTGQQVAVNQNSNQAYLNSLTCVPPLQHWNSVTGQCENVTPNTTGSSQTTQPTQTNSDPTFFGGTILYNSLQDDKGNYLQPCSQSNNVFLIRVDNKASTAPGALKPIILMLKDYVTTLPDGGSIGVGKDSVGNFLFSKGTQVIGNFIPNTARANQGSCLDYTMKYYSAEYSAWPIDGLVVKINWAAKP